MTDSRRRDGASLGQILMCDVMIGGERFAYISEPCRRACQALLRTFEDLKAIDPKGEE